MAESKTSVKHGWFVKSPLRDNTYVDFYESKEAFCHAMGAAAQEALAATNENREVNSDSLNAIPGHWKVPNGTPILINGHTSTNCGNDVAVNLTYIKIIDETSKLRNHSGVMVEGSFFRNP